MIKIICKSNEELKKEVEKLLNQGVTVDTVYGDHILNSNLETKSHENGLIYTLFLEEWEKAEICGNEKTVQIMVI